MQLNTANYYSLVGQMHNELSGLSATDVMTHQPTLQGKYRHVEDLQIADGWGHSGFPIMYYNEWQIGVPKEFIYKSAGWGICATSWDTTISKTSGQSSTM